MAVLLLLLLLFVDSIPLRLLFFVWASILRLPKLLLPDRGPPAFVVVVVGGGGGVMLLTVQTFERIEQFEFCRRKKQ